MLFRHEHYLSGNMRFERVFCFNRLILFVPRIPEGKPCEFTASRKNYSPHIRAWIGWIDWFKTPSQKSTNFVVQCIWPRFFRYDDFINFCYFSFFKKCLVYGKLQKSLYNIYIGSQNAHFVRSCPPQPEITKDQQTYKKPLRFHKT